MAEPDIEMQDFNDPDESTVDDDYDETNIDRPSTGRKLPAVPSNPPGMPRDNYTELKNRLIIYIAKANSLKLWTISGDPDYKRFTVRDNNVYVDNKVPLFIDSNFDKPYAITTIKGKTSEFLKAIGLKRASKVTTLPTYEEKGTKTEGLTGREIEGLNKVMTELRGELRLAIDRHNTAQERLNELNNKELTEDLNEAEEQEKARLPDEIQTRKTQINNLILQIAEKEPSLKQIIKSDLTVREKLKMVFDKYGYTVMGFVTALGLLISLVVEALKPVPVSSASGSTPSNPASSALKTLGKFLKALGEKVLAAIPGLIGSLISFLFKAAGEVVTFLGENLWALAMLTGAII